MDKNQAKKRIDELNKLTAYHAKKYYDDDDPEISDFEYDMLMVELRNLEKEFPEFVPTPGMQRFVNGRYLDDEEYEEYLKHAEIQVLDSEEDIQDEENN